MIPSPDKYTFISAIGGALLGWRDAPPWTALAFVAGAELFWQMNTPNGYPIKKSALDAGTSMLMYYLAEEFSR
jgi:hypothetical protein